MPLTARSPIEPPGKRERPHDEAVGGDGQPGAADLDERGVVERRRRAAGGQPRHDQPFDQPAARLAAGAVRHVDARIA